MKVISKEYISKKRQILRTKQEKKLLSTLRNPFIVNLKCTFQSTPALYIVMELVQVYIYILYYINLFIYLYRVVIYFYIYQNMEFFQNLEQDFI